MILNKLNKVRKSWNDNPCGSKLSNSDNKFLYYQEIEIKRYEKEWHIPKIAKFANYNKNKVLEIGCGIGIDGAQFAKSGALYTGVDLTEAGIKGAKERFALLGLKGNLLVSNGEKLIFKDESFEHIYSFGVIHHTPNTEKVVSEMYRVLKPGGTICIMVYNKNSINYYIEIMFLRKLFRILLRPSFMPGIISRLLGSDRDMLERHRNIYMNKKKMSKSDWLNINTDGPHNPLSKVYGKNDIYKLFSDFDNVRTDVRFFDKSHWPLGNKIIPRWLENALGKKWGWHRIIYGEKAKC